MDLKLHPLENTRQAHGINVQNIDHKNPYDFNVIHRHDYFEIFLFKLGSGGKQIIDFNEYLIEKHCLYIIVPGQVHLMNRLAGENGIVIQFTKEFLIKSLSSTGIEHFYQVQLKPKINLDNNEFQRIYPLFQKLKDDYQSETFNKTAKLGHLFAYILWEIIDIAPRENSIISNDRTAYHFINEVENSFKEVRIVKEYADKLNISLSRLNNAVKKHFGKSPLEIIHEALLTEIKRLLAVEQLSHKEIAYRLNFDSQSSYSRFIKKQCSLTPGELREQSSQIAQK